MIEGSGTARFTLLPVGTILLEPTGASLVRCFYEAPDDIAYWQKEVADTFTVLDSNHTSAREMLPRFAAHLGLVATDVEITGEKEQAAPPPQAVF